MTRRALLLPLVLLAAACDRPKRATPKKGATSAVSFSSGPSSPSSTAWDNALGAVIATPAADAGAPIFFSRDTASAGDIDVELFSHDDRTAMATLHPTDSARVCAWRRRASIMGADGKVAAGTWALALSRGVATPLGIDGVTELTPRDSAALVARIARVVSGIPEDSVTAQFRGLPIVVRDAWRFRISDSTTITIAIATRSLNVESNPRAQSITVIAEPDSTAGSGGLRNAFSESESGPEDRVEGSDLLAAFQLSGARPAVALVREGESGLQLEIVERAAPGAWRIRWTSASLPCANP